LRGKPGLGDALEAWFASHLSESAQHRLSSRVRARPTREGAWFLLLMFGVVLAALNTGNNLLYMVLGCLLAVLVASNVLAEWNIRGLRVQRRLPDEAWAEQGAGGVLIVENQRRFGAGWALTIRDEAVGAAAGVEPEVARARVLKVAPGESVEAPARWSFSARGDVQLAALTVESTFPFGLMRRWRRVPAPATVLVFPRPQPGLARGRVAGRGRARPDQRRTGEGGDFRGLRPYVPGDPLRQLHWPTTARVGRPMVVVRNQEVADEVVVEVMDAHGEAWERSLSRAAGQIQHHVRSGHAVGLRILGAVHTARVGDAWRRHLLGLLAVAPARFGSGRFGEGP
jgi:uncharacterized protein (DUF58 family)